MATVTVKVSIPCFRKYDIIKLGATQESAIVLDIEKKVSEITLITKKYIPKKHKFLNFICFWWVVFTYLISKKIAKIKKWLLSNQVQPTSY